MARIVGFDTQKDSGGMQYFPIVRFVAQTRGEIEVKIEEVRANEPKVGKEVSIFYDALDPREVTINNKWILYFQIFSILVEVFLIYCFAYFIVNHKWLY